MSAAMPTGLHASLWQYDYANVQLSVYVIVCGRISVSPYLSVCLPTNAELAVLPGVCVCVFVCVMVIWFQWLEWM